MRSLLRASGRAYLYTDWANVIRNSQAKRQQKNGSNKRIVSRQTRLDQISRPEVSQRDLESELADLVVTDE
jgi:tRNA G46 methylase TrmB